MNRYAKRIGGFFVFVLIISLTQGTLYAGTNGSETLDILQRAVIPARDPVELARRFLGVTNIPLPPTTPQKYEIGDVVEFRTLKVEQNEISTIDAELWYETPHVYMWFQVGFQPDIEAVKTSAENFENKIYPVVHEYFGTEESPGIDADVHLYILHARELGGPVAAYFDADSAYPRAVVSYSNEHQMFFVNLDTMGDQIGTPYYESVLAHEFQHMVHAKVDFNESSWLNEGLSELAAHLTGYRDHGFAPSFLEVPQTQLNTWSSIW